jgi:chromosome segregation ATPase
VKEQADKAESIHKEKTQSLESQLTQSRR